MSIFSKLTKKKPDKKPSLECAAVIAAAGSSDRMSGEDKLFIDICGKPVLGHALSAFQRCELISEIIVVAREDRIAQVGELCGTYGITKAVKVMCGGQTRLESVLTGVMAVSGNKRLIAIHDGARPCVEEETIAGAINAAAKYNAAAPGHRINSTIKRVVDGTIIETIDRDNIYEIQTPQVFDADIIKAALTNASNKSIDVTDDCMAAELLGIKVKVTDGTQSNIKITTNKDVAIAEAILFARQESGNQ